MRPRNRLFFSARDQLHCGNIHEALLFSIDDVGKSPLHSVFATHTGYVEQLGKFTLKKFLLLVLFLDRAKLTRLIDHDPCLFNKDASFKVCVRTYTK